MMISVIIPLYNKESYIKTTIENVLHQTYQNFEIVVINDGSTDKSPEIVAGINDKRIKLFNKKNGGVSSARNRGIMEAKYDYIAFLDADDEWHPNHLETLAHLIEKYGKEARAFCTNFSRSYKNGATKPNRMYNDLNEGIIENYFKELNNTGVMWTSCVCIAKEVFAQVGYFNTKYTRGEDLDMWYRAARKYKVAYSPTNTVNYVQETDNNVSFRHPTDPTVMYSFHVNLEDCVNKYDQKVHKKMIRRNFLRYILLDYNLKGGYLFFKKQYKNIL